MKDLIPPNLFVIPIQAAIGGNIIRGHEHHSSLITMVHPATRRLRKVFWMRKHGGGDNGIFEAHWLESFNCITFDRSIGALP